MHFPQGSWPARIPWPGRPPPSGDGGAGSLRETADLWHQLGSGVFQPGGSETCFLVKNAPLVPIDRIHGLVEIESQRAQKDLSSQWALLELSHIVCVPHGIPATDPGGRRRSEWEHVKVGHYLQILT